MLIGVYIGSFNPVHIGHIKIARHLIEKNYVDKVLIIPTGNYWNKQDLVDIKDRINMLKLYETDNIIIDDKHNDIEYTYQLLNQLEKESIDNEYALIIGADNIVDFDKWKNYQEILNRQLIILNRNGIDINKYLKKLGKNTKYKITTDLENINISSTDIRNRLKNNEDNIQNIDSEVFSYIKEHNLYK